MLIHDVNTLIIGGGVIGSSVAMHLALRGVDQVRVIDLDLEGTWSSSELNAGGVRATWREPVNIRMSQFTLDYFAGIAEEVGYRACGYLWLHPAGRLQGALKAKDLQESMGWKVEAWDIPELQRRVPFIDKTDGIAGAIFAPRDGLVNPNLVKTHFRSKAKEMGVSFDDRTLARAVEYGPAGQGKITLVAEKIDDRLSKDAKLEIYSGNFNASWKEMNRTPVRYLADQIINCAGPWAAEVASVLRYPSPSFPMRRQICLFDCREVDLKPYGMIIDSSGVYFHPEAENGLAGYASSQEPRGVNFTYDGENFFEQAIWPALYERSTRFERLRHLTGWAGLYEVSPDGCAIIGPVQVGEAGKSGKVFEAHSFSGHGIMHCHAAGYALAERITQGKYGTLELACLAASRFDNGEVLKENLFI